VFFTSYIVPTSITMSENDIDDEEHDSIYENEETQDLINVRELLKSKSLKELLKEDREKIKVKEKKKQWYHGKITRDVAEDVINKGRSFVKYSMQSRSINE